MSTDIQLSELSTRYATDIKGLMVTLAKNKIALGQKLIEAKRNLAHGAFLPMLESVGMGDSAAQKLMKLTTLKIVANTEIFPYLDNFNNSQLKKLDVMYKEDEDKAMEIIKSGKFPKEPKKVEVTDVIDTEVIEEFGKTTYSKEDIMKIIAESMIEFEEIAKEFGYSKSGEACTGGDTFTLKDEEYDGEFDRVFDLKKAETHIVWLEEQWKYSRRNKGEIKTKPSNTVAITAGLLGADNAGVVKEEAKRLGGQKHLAKKIGVSSSVVSNAANGKPITNKKVNSYFNF